MLLGIFKIKVKIIFELALIVSSRFNGKTTLFSIEFKVFL